MINPVRTWQQDMARWGMILAGVGILIGVALYVFRVVPPIKLSSDDVSRIGYFDAATGKPKVYFKRQKNGKFDLFDRPGFHPNTQEPLEPVTPENVREIEKFITSEAAKAKLLEAQQEAEQKRLIAETNRLAATVTAEQQAARDNQSPMAAQQTETHAQYHDAMLALATKNGCLACHAVDRKVVGPSFVDISRRYKNASAITYNGARYSTRDWLVMKVSKGGSGIWGSIPMIPNDPSGSKQGEIRQLVEFVLGLENQTGAVNAGNENADSAMLKDAHNTLDKLLKQ